MILFIILRSLSCIFGNTFTMVEENFGFYSSEMLQSERISIHFWRIFSLWLKKILNFTTLKCSRMKDFHWFLDNTFTMVEEDFEFFLALECSRMKGFPFISGEYFHHGWRKFRILQLWNAPEWRISIHFWRTLSPWLKKILNFTALKCSRMKNFHWLLDNTFTMVEEDI